MFVCYYLFITHWGASGAHAHAQVRFGARPVMAVSPSCPGIMPCTPRTRKNCYEAQKSPPRLQSLHMKWFEGPRKPFF